MTSSTPIVRNHSFSSVLSQFQVPVPCDISTFQLQVKGQDANGNSVSYDIRIMACADRPFSGPHLVTISDLPAFWVQSLSAFRKNFFTFTDHLSFERSFYVIFNNDLHIRLQNLRFIATLPRMHLDPHTIIFCSPSQPIEAHKTHHPRQLKNPDQVRKEQIKIHVEKLLALYLKLYPISHIECMHMLCTDFQETCADIMETIENSKQFEM